MIIPNHIISWDQTTDSTEPSPKTPTNRGISIRCLTQQAG
jgi:hypothetical protein